MEEIEKSPATISKGSDNQCEDNEFQDVSQINPVSITNDIVYLENQAQQTQEPKGLFSATELLCRNIEAIPTLLDPLFPKVGVVAIAGSSDTGKSSFLRQFAVSVALGDSHFLQFKLNPLHRRVVYVSTEDDDIAVSFLLQKGNRYRHLDPNEYKGLLYLFETDNLVQRLDSILGDSPQDAVIIDSFTDLYGKSLNEANQVRTYLNEFSQLAQRHSCLIIFLHHTGKRTEDMMPSKHNLVGSQGFESKMRMVIELRTDPVSPEKRHLCIVKGNYLPSEYKHESYVLVFDENLQFTSTGDRLPFEMLIKMNDGEETSKEKYIEALELKNSGLTYKEIAPEIGYKSKGSVTKLFQKAEKNGWAISVSDGNTGNEMETPSF